MKTRITLLLCIAAVFMQAQSYSSRKIEEIGSKMPAGGMPLADSIFNCSEIVKGKSVVVTYNRDQEIDHLGISLFSDETKALINLPVCNFIERIMLELVLEKTKESTIQTMKRSGLNIKKNGFEYGTPHFTSINNILDGIKNPARFTLHKNQETYIAVWEYDYYNQLVFSFPASRDLIFGTDKKESDELLNNTLFGGNSHCHEEDNIFSDEVSEDDLLFNPGKNIFIKKGDTFLLPLINSDTYYIKTGDTFKLLFSEGFPEESISNLVIKNTGNYDRQLHITHRMYGHFSPGFDISLEDFLCFFRDDHDIFTAVSESGPEKMKLTVVLHNRDYNYIHLLLINTSIEGIFHNNSTWIADFYSNMPQQNIKNLFADEIKKYNN